MGSLSSNAGSPPLVWVACLARAASVRPMSSRLASSSVNRWRWRVRIAVTAAELGSSPARA